MHQAQCRLKQTQLWPVFVLIVAASSSLAANSPAQIMSRAMLSMMDTMGNLAQQYKKSDNWSFANNSRALNSWQNYNHAFPWWLSGYSSDYYPGTLPDIPYPPAPQYRADQRSEVDGIWIGQSGEIVLVMYGYFRIYASAENYRDGQYRIIGDVLLMHDPESGATLGYQFALDRGKMIMRDRFGNLLFFKQLPIPIPPYAIPPNTNTINREFKSD
jgi:hypothetical protein